MINDYFDKIYCINLDSRPDRWGAVSKKFYSKKINVERFPAVSQKSKRAINLFNKVKKIYPTFDSRRKNSVIRSIGAAGCLLSHIDIIKKSKNNGYKKILIFEDDIIFHKDFNSRSSLIKGLSPWSLLYLGCSQHDWRGVKKYNDNFYIANNTDGTFGYAIKSSSFDILINMSKNTLRPIDGILRGYQNKCPGKSFVFSDNLVIADVTDSDIRESRGQVNHSKRMRWDLSNYEVK